MTRSIAVEPDTRQSGAMRAAGSCHSFGWIDTPVQWEPKSHPQYLSSNDVLGPAWHGSRVLRNKATNEGKTWAPDPEAGAHVFGALALSN